MIEENEPMQDEKDVIRIDRTHNGNRCRGRIIKKNGKVTMQYEGDDDCGREIRRIAEIISEEE